MDIITTQEVCDFRDCCAPAQVRMIGRCGDLVFCTHHWLIIRKQGHPFASVVPA